MARAVPPKERVYVTADGGYLFMPARSFHFRGAYWRGMRRRAWPRSVRYRMFQKRLITRAPYYAGYFDKFD